MTHQSHRFLIGIDVGGTFTDAVVTSALDGAILDAFKLPSTPLDPSVAVIEAFHRIHRTYPLNEAMVCHGTTIGTNLLIQHRGAKTALLATKGFTDVIELRRQNRPTLYDLNVKISPPLVDTDMRFAVSERCDARGKVLENLSTGVTSHGVRRASSGDSLVARLRKRHARKNFGAGFATGLP